MGKNNLLSGISESRNQIDNPQFSKRIVAFGILMSYCLMLVPAKEYLMERDNAAILSERYEIEKENLSEEETALIEKALKGEVVCDEVFWGEYESYDGTSQNDVLNSMILIHKSKLYELLLKAKEKFVNEKSNQETDEVQAEDEWKKIAEKIVNDYLSENVIEDDSVVKEVKSEWADMERKLYGEALSELLYDQYSLKKEADSNAAGIVTDKLISDVEDETRSNLDVLFETLKVDSEYDESSFNAEKDEWFESFQKYIEEGMVKWQKVETDFLSAKYEFENEAGEKYVQDVQKWADAYDELLERKNKWNEEIEQRLAEGIMLWQQKSEKLNFEIDKAMEDYKNEMLAEYRQKNEEFAVNCEIYTQTRTLLTTACNEVKDWIGVWADKYDGLYSYWKTEDNEENEIKELKSIEFVNQNNYKKIKSLIQNIKKMYSESVSDLKKKNNPELKSKYRDYLSEDQVLWSELELVENWLEIIAEYSKTLNQCIQNLEKAGFNYSDSTYVFSSFETEYSMLENTVKECEKEVEIAKAVYEYSIDNTSKVEKKQNTENNLKKAEEKTDAAEEEYQALASRIDAAKIEYETALSEYENQKKIVSEFLEKLEDARIDYKTLELSSSFTTLNEMKENYAGLVNSINQIKNNEKENRNNVIDLMKLIENYSYCYVYKNAEIMIDNEYEGYDVEYEDEKGNLVSCHVEGISELKKELKNEYSAEKVSMLHAKLETVNYLEYGTFGSEYYSDVDYDEIVEACKNYSVDHCIENDIFVKNEIKQIIDQFKKEGSDSYFVKSDEEIDEFFARLDECIAKNECSDFIKQELDIYRNQIVYARMQKKYFSECDDIFNQINEVYGKTIIVDEFNYDLESYELFFDSEKSIYDDKLSLSADEYQSQFDEIYSSLCKKQEKFQDNLEDIVLDGGKLFEVYEANQEAMAVLEAAKQNVDVLNEQYSQEVKKCNGNNKDSCFSRLKSSIEKYNDLNQIVNEKFEFLEQCRHEEDVCREVYNWAQNEYLHLGYEFDDMDLPEERYSRALSEYENAKNALAEYETEMAELNVEDHYELLDDSGNNVLLEYENSCRSYCAVQVFQYEIEEAINVQSEKLYKAQLDAENYMGKIIVETEASDFELTELVKRFVSISVNENDGKFIYDISFNDSVLEKGQPEDNESESFYDYCKGYVTERNVKQYSCEGNELYYSQSAVDALNFLNELADKSYSIDDLLLALCYIKLNFENDDLLFEGENPEKGENYELGSIKDEVQGFHVADDYEDGRLDTVKRAYKKVKDENGFDDMAKLVFYSTYNLNDSFDLENREIDYIAINGMDYLKGELRKEILLNQALFATLSITAAATALCACLPFCGFLYAVAAAIQIVAITYGVRANDLSDVKDDVFSIQKGYKVLYNDIIFNADNNVDNYINSKNTAEAEKLNLMNLLYGDDEESEENITYKKFENEIKKILNKNNGSSINFDYLKNLYKNDKEIKSLEELFDAAVEDKKCTTTLDAVNYIADFIEKRYSDCSQLVSETADKARSQENWNESLFQREMGKIAFDNFVDDVPVKISRKEESYISDGFDFLQTCYNNILSEYYSNKLIQKQNELDSKKDAFNKQFSDWITCIKNIKSAAETEWNKAEEQFAEKFNVWNEQWLDVYSEIEDSYEEQYENILKEKSEWINKNYTEQALGIGLNTINDEGFDSQLELIREKADEIVSTNRGFIFDALDISVSENLFDMTSFENISSCMNSLNSEVLRNSILIFNSEKINLFDYQKNELIESTVESLNEKINEASLMSSVETALEAINERIEELYFQINQSNENFEKWEKELVLKDGYSYGNVISRNAIVHSIIFGGNVRERQTVHKYEYFTCEGPEINFSYGNVENFELLTLVMQNNYGILNDWYEEIFGSEQKKGLLAEHIGTEPVFVENVNTEKKRVENISNPGSGQLGFVMLDFIWNDAVNRAGYDEIAVPMYEKKLTEENEICGIELPTVRDITSVVFDIVANCTGQKWIAIIDDIAFGITDLTLEQKSADQVFMGIASASASMGIGSVASSAVNTVSNSAMNQISKAFLTSGIKMAQSYTSSVASSYINAVSFEDGFYIDWDKANSVWTDDDVLKNSISAGAVSFMNDSLNNLTLTDGTGRLLNDSYYNVSAVQSLNSTISNVAVAGAEIMLSGTTTVNLLNLGGTGLLALTISDEGVSAKIGSEGLNLNVVDAVNGISGIGDAAWVTGAKVSAALGNENNVALLNGINCLSYYSPERAGELAKEIWDGNKTVNVKNMDALGRTLGNVIEVSDIIAGNNDESAVQIASILLHEDAHSQGLDEFQARIVGYDLYSNMSGVYDTSKKIYENVSDVSFFTEAYKQFGEEGLYMMMQLTDAFSHHDDGWDYYLAETIDSGIKQNLSDNNFIALGNSLIKKKIDEYNNAHIEESYEKYMKDGYQEYVNLQIELGKLDEKEYLSYEDFCSSGLLKYGDKSVFAKAILEKNKELSAYHFAVKDFVSIGDYGCVLSTATYITYSLTGELYSLREANDICKGAGVFNGAYISWGEDYKNAVNALVGEEALTEYGRASKLVEKNNLLNDITSSDDAYFVVARVLDDSHATLLKSQQDDYTYKGDKKTYNSLDVLNSWYSTNPNSKLGAKNYKMSEVSNLTWYKVNGEYLNKYKNNAQYREAKMKEIKQRYAY